MPAAINEVMKKYILFCLQFTVCPKQPPHPAFGVTQVDLELMILPSHKLWGAVITGVSHHPWPNLP